MSAISMGLTALHKGVPGHQGFFFLTGLCLFLILAQYQALSIVVQAVNGISPYFISIENVFEENKKINIVYNRLISLIKHILKSLSATNLMSMLDVHA